MYMYCEPLSSSDCHLRVLVSNIIFHMTYPPPLGWVPLFKLPCSPVHVSQNTHNSHWLFDICVLGEILSPENTWTVPIISFTMSPNAEDSLSVSDE